MHKYDKNTYQTWNDIVKEIGGGPLHSFEWAIMKQLSGSVVEYFHSDNDFMKFALPVFIKNLFGVKIGWVPDGLIHKGDSERFYSSLVEMMRKNNLVMLFTEAHLFFEANVLHDHQIKIPFRNPAETIVHDLSDISLSELMTLYNQSTRKYVRKAINLGFECKVFEIDELPSLYKLYFSLSSENKFKPMISLDSLLQLFSLIDQGRNKQNTLRRHSVKVEHNNEYSFLITLSLGNRTLEFLRANAKSKESKYISRLLTHNALSQSIDTSSYVYDFGGVERKRNPGVFSYKSSFGGKLSSSTGLKAVINRFLFL